MNSFDAHYRRNLLAYAGLLMGQMDLLEDEVGVRDERPTDVKQAAARLVCEQWCKVMRELEKSYAESNLRPAAVGT
jgi:hypothetical protein